MGVTRLGELLRKEQVAGAVQSLCMAEWRGKRWVVEVSAFMHRFLKRMECVDNNEHLHCFVQMYRSLQQKQVHVCFVFDGKQTAAKRDENQRRAQARDKQVSRAQATAQQVEQQIAQLEASTAEQQPEEGFAAMVKLATLKGQLATQQRKATRHVKTAYYAQLRALFIEEGIPFVTARYEAEQACAWLMREGYADLVVSDDYDCLACGAPAFLQHYDNSLHEARIIHLQPLLDHLRMSYGEFVDFCILCGTCRSPGSGLELGWLLLY